MFIVILVQFTNRYLYYYCLCGLLGASYFPVCPAHRQNRLIHRTPTTSTCVFTTLAFPKIFTPLVIHLALFIWVSDSTCNSYLCSLFLIINCIKLFVTEHQKFLFVFPSSLDACYGIIFRVTYNIFPSGTNNFFFSSVLYSVKI